MMLKPIRDLTKAERNLLAAAESGDWARGSIMKDPLDDAENYEKDDTIRSELIRRLLLGQPLDGKKPIVIHPAGLRIRGVEITDRLNLEYCNIEHPIWFERSRLTLGISLYGASTRRIHLECCRIISGLEAGCAKIAGEFILNKKTTIDGETNLFSTHIDGYLDLSSAILNNADGIALDASGTTISKSALLRENIKAIGEVNFIGATIKGQLDCSSAEFSNVGKVALQANGVIIGNSVLLTENFHSKGEINLAGSQINGALYCTSAKLHNRHKIALNANAAIVQQGVFLNDKFESDGKVTFVNSRIDGLFVCIDAKLTNPGNIALDADSAKIGTVLIRAPEPNPESADVLFDTSKRLTEIYGTVNLWGAEISGNVQLCGFVSRAPGARARAAINLARATIKGDLQFAHERHKARNVLWHPNLNGGGVDLRGCSARDLIDTPGFWASAGEVKLDGFTYERMESIPADPSAQQNSDETDKVLFEDRLRILGKQPLEDLKINFRPQPWEQMAKVMRDMGHQDAARMMMIEKLDRHYPDHWLSKATHWLLGATCQYGYGPWRAVTISTVVIAFFAITYRDAFRAGYFAPADDDIAIKLVETMAMPDQCYAIGTLDARPCYHAHAMKAQDCRKILTAYTSFDAFLYSLDVFVPVIDLHQDTSWTPADARNLPIDTSECQHSVTRTWRGPNDSSTRAGMIWWTKVLMFVETIVGFMLTSLIIVSFTGLLRKE